MTRTPEAAQADARAFDLATREYAAARERVLGCERILVEAKRQSEDARDLVATILARQQDWAIGDRVIRHGDLYDVVGFGAGYTSGRDGIPADWYLTLVLRRLTKTGRPHRGTRRRDHIRADGAERVEP